MKILVDLVTCGGRFAFPFVLVLAVSSTLAYALNDALVASRPAMGQSATVCGVGVMYVGLNTRIPLGAATQCAFREP